MYVNNPMGQFLDDLASSAPAPGGGSVAALSGALGAALISMVCNLTIGKEKYKDVEADVQAILERSEVLRRELMDLLEADTQLYGKVIAAYRQPKNTEEEKAARLQAIDAALKEACGVPMQIAKRCAELVELCVPAAAKGNVGAISDIGVAVLMAEAGLVSAKLNVDINLGSIKDASFVEQGATELAGYLRDKAEIKARVLKEVEEKL
ncbi:MAG: cyclodeaminase/cyclohydrolase family protein [Chloroflexi bacterium]|nr:cyclodeaminase/cyclohydrolase family protein [Chloroflexota bacterium]MDA8189420.1 cyclodeaminase/cyclohydrolase family protein [Dehalococcoidales bacterium]